MESVSPGMVILSDIEGEEVEGVNLCVVDVCSNREIFTQFVAEWRSRDGYSLAVAMDRCKDKQQEDRMVGNTRGASQAREQSRLLLDTGVMVGLAVCWTGLEVFYLSLEMGEEVGRPEDSLAPPTQDESISVQERLSMVSQVMGGTAAVSALQWRRQASLLYSVTGQLWSGSHSDPGVAAWVLDPAAPQSTLSKLVLEHSPSLTSLLSTLGSGPGCGSLAANPAAS